MNQHALDGLAALKLVAEKRNFTAAADELGISPPAISKIIKLLEHRLGVALLSRTTRSTSLTEAGERFLNQVAPAVDQIVAAMKDLGAYAAKPSGLLRLNLPKFSYASHLAPLIASFVARYTDVSVELFSRTSHPMWSIRDSTREFGIQISLPRIWSRSSYLDPSVL